MHMVGVQLLRYAVDIRVECALFVSLLLDSLEILLFNLRILAVHPLDLLLLIFVCSLDIYQIV